jgi:ABC-type nitrate/sulfonate/bicarbonate transport system substrate-binding protein
MYLRSSPFWISSTMPQNTSKGLGNHRDGTALMVHKDSNIFKIEDLRGKTVGVPSRFSNQRLLLFRAFKQRHLDIRELKMPRQ